MSTISPFNPGVELNAQFVRPVNNQLPDHAAYVFGPAAHVLRYTRSEERADSALGQFSNDGELLDGVLRIAFAWPNKPVGSTIDSDFTKLFVERGMLQYWQSPSEVFSVTGRDRIKHATLSFATNGSFLADSVFGNGVRVGDGILIEGMSGGEPFRMFTNVRGFAGDMSVPAVSGAVPAPGNADEALSGTYVISSGPSDPIEMVPVLDEYNGLPFNRLSDTYTVTVTQASTGGDWTTARLTVSNSDGTDVHTNVAPATAGTSVSVGPRNFHVEFAPEEAPAPDPLPDFVVGMTWTVTVSQMYDEPVTVVTGPYTATDQHDRQYLVQVLEGASIADGPIVRISELRGRDISNTIKLTTPDDEVTDPFAVGSYGITMTLESTTGLLRGDRWVITATAAKPEQMRTLILARVLPEDIDPLPATNEIQVTLFSPYTGEINHKSEIPGVFNYETTETELLVKSDVTVQLPDRGFTGNPYLPLTQDVAMGTTANTLYATYRAWLTRSTSLQSIVDPAELSQLIAGPTDSSNPLKYALSKALLVSSGVPVFFANTGNPNTLGNWELVLELSSQRRDVYGLVPLTTNNAVLDMVAGHVLSRSSPRYNMYRRAWYTNDIRDTGPVADESNSDDQELLLATVTDDPDQTGTQFTLVTLSSDNFSFDARGIRAGDRLRVAFSTDPWGDQTNEEFIIDQVVSDSVLRLVSGPAVSESIPTKIEIWRTLQPSDRVDLYSGRISGFFSPTAGDTASPDGRYPGFRFCYLPFGWMIDGFETVPAYYAAAMVAAARGALPPHAPMTKLALPGFDGVDGQDGMNDDQLNVIAASGGFLFEANENGAGLRVRHAVTAGEWDDVNTREESVISNVDSINTAIVQMAKPYIGRTNVTNQLLALMRADLSVITSILLSDVYGPLIGPQVLDFELTQLRRSPVGKDTVLLSANYEVPGPTNKVQANILIR